MLPLYDRYFDYKVFELFRDRMLPIVSSHRQAREGHFDPYTHIFLAPQQVATTSSFTLHGVTTPLVCLYPTSYFNWTDSPALYSRSVLQRKFSYPNPDGSGTVATMGYLYDMKKTYRLFASGYFQDFTQRVSQDLLDFDRLRYHQIDCGELLPSCSTRVELLPTSISSEAKLDETSGSRSFDLAVDYQLSVTFPVVDAPRFISAVEIYLNDNKIYEAVLK